MKCPTLLFLLCLVGASSAYSQSVSLADGSSGSLVTVGPAFAFGSDGSVQGLSVEFGYSHQGRLDAGGRYSAVGGLTPTVHNCHVITTYFGYSVIKQNRESKDPISLSIRTEFDILLPDAGVYSFDRAEDPDGIFRVGLSISHAIGNWSSPVSPVLTVLYSKPISSDVEAKIAIRAGLAILFPSTGKAHFMIFPQVEKHGETGSARFNIGFMF
ncbi:MAG: hypothetical protein IPH75_09905 [bacterium]|nr:hypothetical protein [bacterium]